MPLPKEHIFLKGKVINARLYKGESPIDLSIEKWKIILKALNWVSSRELPHKYIHNFLEDNVLGQNSCALCKTSKKKYIDTIGDIKYQDDKCKVCPLSKVDQCTRKESSYDLIEFSFYKCGEESNNEESMLELSSAIKKMIANLENLKLSE